MRYTISHVTRFTYDSPVSESHMEVRMQPRTGDGQRCLDYHLHIDPRTRPQSYRDHLSNWVDHFSVPHRHEALTITAHARVEVDAPPELPPVLDAAAWHEVDEWSRQDAHWDLWNPSRFAEWTESLTKYAGTIPAARERSTDPLSTVRGIMSAVHRDFEYAPNSTQVDSPIDQALAARRGVCQDFAHITVAMLRRLGLPSRYVSGYIAPDSADEAASQTPSATHAWVEVLLPTLGWRWFDPTNDREAGVRHIRVAVGRDYADVPPARGVYKGTASSSLAVSIAIGPEDTTDAVEPFRALAPASIAPIAFRTQGGGRPDLQQGQQQQQQ
jgi:transglutaminase-like putative cysteine protease